MTKPHEIPLSNRQFIEFVRILKDVKAGRVADCASWRCVNCMKLFEREYTLRPVVKFRPYGCPCYMFSKRLLVHRVRQLLKFNRRSTDARSCS